MFTTYFRDAGGRFDGGWRNGRRRRAPPPFATLDSPPLYDIVRDVNKLSNNVMARQVFLTLATANAPPPATTAGANAAIRGWLARRNLQMPELVLENGSGLSRIERISAGGLARLLLAADASPVRDEFASSLAVAATDGTVERRFQNGTVAGQALLKTGTLEGVRALAGYVIDAEGRRWMLAALVNHANAARGSRARSISSCSGSTATRRRGRRRRATDHALPSGRGTGASRRAVRAGLRNSHARHRLAVVEQQVAADHPIEHPDRRHGPDEDRDGDADEDEAENDEHDPADQAPRAANTRTCGSASGGATRPTSRAPRRASRSRR